VLLKVLYNDKEDSGWSVLLILLRRDGLCRLFSCAEMVCAAYSPAQRWSVLLILLHRDDLCCLFFGAETERDFTLLYNFLISFRAMVCSPAKPPNPCRLESESVCGFRITTNYITHKGAQPESSSYAARFIPFFNLRALCLMVDACCTEFI